MSDKSLVSSSGLGAGSGSESGSGSGTGPGLDWIVARLRAGESVPFRGRGHSMWPAIRDGQIVRVEPLGPGSPLARGRVVLCLAPGGHLVLHRVVGVGDGGVITKGDAMGRDDGLTPRTQILGAVMTRPWDRAVGAISARMGPRGARVVARLRVALTPGLVRALAAGRKLGRFRP